MKKFTLILLPIVALSLTTRKLDIPKKDKEFMMTAARTGMMEVKLGALASANGASPTVKMLGEHMVADHSKANAELKALAEKKGIALPLNIDDKQQKCYQEMFEKKGDDFDKAYTKCMVKDHDAAISTFKKEAQDGEDADLKNWASNTIPTLEQHKQMSKEACSALKKDK